MKTSEKSVEEIVDKNSQHGKLEGDLEITQYIPVYIFLETLQAERQRCEEMVEAERERIANQINALLDKYKKGMYATKDSPLMIEIREALTQPNNPK